MCVVPGFLVHGHLLTPGREEPAALAWTFTLMLLAATPVPCLASAAHIPAPLICIMHTCPSQGKVPSHQWSSCPARSPSLAWLGAPQQEGDPPREHILTRGASPLGSPLAGLLTTADGVTSSSAGDFVRGGTMPTARRKAVGRGPMESRRDSVPPTPRLEPGMGQVPPWV